MEELAATVEVGFELIKRLATRTTITNFAVKHFIRMTPVMREFRLLSLIAEALGS